MKLERSPGTIPLDSEGFLCSLAKTSLKTWVSLNSQYLSASLAVRHSLPIHSKTNFKRLYPLPKMCHSEKVAGFSEAPVLCDVGLTDLTLFWVLPKNSDLESIKRRCWLQLGRFYFTFHLPPRCAHGSVWLQKALAEIKGDSTSLPCWALKRDVLITLSRHHGKF